MAISVARSGVRGWPPTKVILKASTFLRSLNLFLELRIWTVPRSLAADEPGRTGEPGTESCRTLGISSQYPPSRGTRGKDGHSLALQNFVRGLVYKSVNGPLAHLCAPLCVPRTPSVLIPSANRLTSATMISLCCLWLALFVSPLKSKSRLEAENAALRHQLIILRRKVRGRVRLTDGDGFLFHPAVSIGGSRAAPCAAREPRADLSRGASCTVRDGQRAHVLHCVSAAPRKPRVGHGASGARPISGRLSVRE